MGEMYSSISAQMGLVNINEINPCMYIEYCSLELRDCQKDLFVHHADGSEFVETLTHSCYKEASQQRPIGTSAYEANVLVVKSLVALQEFQFEYANGN